jgi:hypothetical protein
VQVISTAPVLTPATSTPVHATDDIREGYASRKWKEILDAEKNGESPALLKNKIEKFADAYANTKAGKEAREKLASFAVGEPVETASTVPNTVPPAVLTSPAPTQPPVTMDDSQKAGIPDGAVLYCDFDKDCGRLQLNMGKRTSENSLGGGGSSLKSGANTSGYFTSGVKIELKDPFAIKADTWIRFACYVEGSKQICLHTLFEPKVCEKFVKNVPQKKWFWVNIRVSDYEKQLNGKGSGQPDPGAKFRHTSIYTCGGGSLYVDNFSIGEGPLPSEK